MLPMPTVKSQLFSSSILSHLRRSSLDNGITFFNSRFFSNGANVTLRGIDILRCNKSNKDLAFTMREREYLSIKGLLPPVIRGQDAQERAAMEFIRHLENDLTRYNYLRDLQDYNQRLFYRLLSHHPEELMPVVYTPTVGDACLKYSDIFKRPRGLFISIHDSGHIASILNNWHEKEIKAVVVTDGERILGLGDLGANGMGIPVGKLSLYTALAGVKPWYTLPICIDVGTDNETLLRDPFYIGIKQRRTRGAEYDDLLDEFMEAVVNKWGRSCLIQFEDFGNQNAFRLLDKYNPHFCTFNDDIQGTAAVVVAGILASCKPQSMQPKDHTYFFFGAGEAALGTADLLVKALEEDGLSVEEARSRIWLMDKNGLLVADRPEGEMDDHKLKYAKNVEPMRDLEEIIDLIKPSAIFGVAAQPGAFNETILRKVASFTDRPLIFPLSNPTRKAECTAQEAFHYTDGRCIFASGSPFPPMLLKGKTLIPGQGNNAYIFPGVALAAICCEVHFIPDKAFLVAAHSLADMVTKENFEEGRIYPPLSLIKDVSTQIAAELTKYFYDVGLANVQPEPADKLQFIKDQQYNYFYNGEKSKYN